MHHRTLHSSSVPKEDVAAQFNTSKDLLQGIYSGSTWAYTFVINILQLVLSRFSSPMDKKKLRMEDIDSAPALLSRLWVDGKLKGLAIADDARLYISRIARNFVIDVVSAHRNKSKENFVRNLISYDAPIKKNDSETAIIHILGDTLKEEDTITAEQKLIEAESRMYKTLERIKETLPKSKTPLIYEAIYNGFKQELPKAKRVEEFKAYKLIEGAVDTDLAGWYDRYNLSLCRFKKTMR